MFRDGSSWASHVTQVGRHASHEIGSSNNGLVHDRGANRNSSNTGTGVTTQRVGGRVSPLGRDKGYTGRGHGGDLDLRLHLKTGFDTGLPESFPVVDEPICELLELDAGCFHDLGLFLLGRVGMGNVFWTHHPRLQEFDCFRRKTA